MVELWQQPEADVGNDFFQQCYRSVMQSHLPSRKVDENSSGRPADLHIRHRITNAFTEGFNSKIQAIEDCRSTILFFCGKLDLAPYLA